MQSPKNIAVIAAAGSRKTEQVVESALAVTSGRVLITTYTNENQREIIRRIRQRVGVVPQNLSVMGWFSFLINQCARPYQRSLTGSPLVIRSLNFKGARSRFTRKSDILRYFLDSNQDMYRDGVSDFVVQLNSATKGSVTRRLERIYSHILVDELQDLVGYDLDVLELLLASRIKVTLVGDPRQHTLSTNLGGRHKRYRGVGLLDWFREREDLCALDQRTECYRSNQLICDFADSIYPTMPRTRSVMLERTDHDGIFSVKRGEARDYFATYRPEVLRDTKKADTLDFPAMNIGVAKGCTFDRVLIFPTKPMLMYLGDLDPSKLKAPERLYVAVTRARYSAAFVIPD